MELVLLFLLHTIVIIKSCMIYSRLVCSQVFFPCRSHSLEANTGLCISAYFQSISRCHWSQCGDARPLFRKCSFLDSGFWIYGKVTSFGAFLSSHFADFLGFEIVCIVWSGRGIGGRECLRSDTWVGPHVSDSQECSTAGLIKAHHSR